MIIFMDAFVTENSISTTRNVAYIHLTIYIWFHFESDTWPNERALFILFFFFI